MTPFTTSSGLQIGRCYIRPAMRVQGDAVVIQSVLLSRRTRPADRAVNWTIVISILAIILSIAYQGAPK